MLNFGHSNVIASEAEPKKPLALSEVEGVAISMLRKFEIASA